MPGLGLNQRMRAALQRRAPAADPCASCALATTKGERIAPGVTRIRGNLCNVHGRYGKCPSGASSSGAAATPATPAEQRAQTRFEQQQQDRAARQQRQAQRDQERAADRQRKIQAEAEKRQRELEKPKKGGGGGKGKAPKPEKPAKQTPEEKRQASRDAVKQWMRDNDEGLAPPGFDGLLQFADGGKLSATVEQALRGMGLVEGDVGAPRLSAAAHVAVNAINSGNSRGAADAIRKAQERANAAAERAGRKKESYGGTPRGELPDSAFAGPGRSFPIKSARDVRNAIRALGRTKHDRDAVKRGIVRRARAIGATSALPETWKGSGLHVYKDAAGRDRWLTITTTAYEDRDGEIITVKGIAHAVTHGDRTGQRGPLRFWHVPGLDLGDCDFQAQGGPGGRWLIESGTFRGPREARIGQAMAAKGWQMSPGFLHPVTEPYPAAVGGRQVGLFDTPVIFERSATPPGRASNLFGRFTTTKERPMLTDEKRAALKELVGDDPLLTELLARVDRTDKAAQDAGVAYKDAPAWAQALVGEVQALGERLKAVEARPAVVNTTTVVAEKATDQARLDEAVGEDLAVDTEDAADMADEADHPDAEQDEALFLKLASSMAPLIAQAVVEALTPQLGEVKAAMDVDKKMAAHIADLKSTLGTMTAQKDATIAELKGAVAELRGEQPLAAQVPRPSQDPATRLPPELAAAIKGFAPTTDEPPASTDVISSFLGAFKGFGTT